MRLKSTNNKIKSYCKCLFCGNFFVIITRKKLFCSDSCKKKNYYQKKKGHDENSF